MSDFSNGLKRRDLFKATGLSVASFAIDGLLQKVSAASAPYVADESVIHTRIWMAFPKSTAIWGASLLKKVQEDWALLCRTVAKYESVTVLCNGAISTAQTAIGKTVKPVTYSSMIAYDDMWMRDSGCVFRRNGNGGLEGIQLNFNGWGGQQISRNDAKVAAAMCGNLNIPVVKASVAGEGGGVICDGDGTLIANWSSWNGHNRNPGKTRDQVGAELRRVYNAQKIIWSDGVVGQDITDAHIDATCCFIKPGVLAFHKTRSGATDVWSKDINNTLKILQGQTDAKGRVLQFVFLPEPVNTRSTSPDLLNTYINFLIVNGAVITANFGDATTDAQAKTILANAFPGRTVEMLNLDNIYGKGGGGIHCVTQQQPVSV